MIVIDTVETGKKMHEMAREKYKMRHFAQLLGLTSSTVMYRWFNGECLPHIEKIFQIADLLDVTVDELVVVKRADIWV